MIFLYDNKIDDYSITANSCETDYPITNIQDFQLEKVWRSTSDSTEWVKIHSTSGIGFNYIGIAGHNLTTSATVTIQAGTSDSWVSPTFTTALTPTTEIFVSAVTASTYDWIRFKLNDASNSDGYIEVGRLFLGNKFDVGALSVPEITVRWEDTSIVKWSITGQSYSDEGLAYRIIEGIEYPVIGNTTKKNIETMFKDVKTAEPIFLLVYPSITTDLESFYCNFIDTPKFQHIEDMNWIMNPLSFREAK